jgi:hypothetical protein
MNLNELIKNAMKMAKEVGREKRLNKIELRKLIEGSAMEKARISAKGATESARIRAKGATESARIKANLTEERLHEFDLRKLMETHTTERARIKSGKGPSFTERRNIHRDAKKDIDDLRDEDTREILHPKSGRPLTEKEIKGMYDTRVKDLEGKYIGRKAPVAGVAPKEEMVITESTGCRSCSKRRDGYYRRCACRWQEITTERSGQTFSRCNFSETIDSKGGSAAACPAD